MKIKTFFVVLLTMAVVFCGSVFAGGGVTPDLPDLGFAWPAWALNVGGYLDTAANWIAAASVLAALTPTKRDDGFLKIFGNVVRFLALNVLNAKPEQR